MSDVHLFHQADGGNLEFAGPDDPTTDIKLDTGLETAVYLSWFGGNAHDHGLVRDDNETGHNHNFRWWGNLGESEDRQMISETAHLLLALPATSNNLLLVEDAAVRDIQWMLDGDYATEATVSVALISVNRILLTAQIIMNKQQFVVALESQWGE
jgi:hypothetical protein